MASSVIKSAKIESPGPLSRSALAELNTVWDARAAHFLADYGRSSGVYITDVDGNRYLDVYCQIASSALGYNNRSLVEAARSSEMVNALVNRPATGNYPSRDWFSSLRDGLLRVAPPGLHKITTAQSGSEANELAFKAAFMLHQYRKRGKDTKWTEEEMASSLNNAAPGSPELAVLSFTCSFHGRSIGALATTRSKAIHKMDIPTFDWPKAPFPELRYPLQANVERNQAEEEKCLQEVERLLTTWRFPVAALIVEPIQSEGGDNHASPRFFQSIRDMTRRLGVTMIVDEVQTGFGPTGKFWAHEHWNLTFPPDIVTFSKKAQSAGFYFQDPELVPDKPYRHFNTWLGDPARVLMSKAVVKEILEKGLVEQAARVGSFLYEGLEKLAVKHPKHIENLRGAGRGTYIAFDTASASALVAEMKKHGVNMGLCGPRGVRIRPMLIFEEEHADMLIETLDQVMGKDRSWHKSINVKSLG